MLSKFSMQHLLYVKQEREKDVKRVQTATTIFGPTLPKTYFAFIGYKFNFFTTWANRIQQGLNDLYHIV